MKRFVVLLVCVLLVAVLLTACANTPAMPHDDTSAQPTDSGGDGTNVDAAPQDDDPAVQPTTPLEDTDNGVAGGNTGNTGTDTDMPDGTDPAANDGSGTPPAPLGGDETPTPNPTDTPASTPDPTPTSAVPVGIAATCTGAQTAGQALQGVTVQVTYSDSSTATVQDYVLADPYASYHADTAYTQVSYTQDGVTLQCTMTYTLAQRADAPNTIYFTNNVGWGRVNAYVWRESDLAAPTAWPGQACTFVETNSYGEGVWQFVVPAGYDRVVFNDGSGNQTADLVVNGAVSGYYVDGSETAGTFAQGAADYGTVHEVVLDAPNLGGTGTKKVYIYTPAGYTPTRVYKVLYCFDGQNMLELRKGAAGCAAHTWQADVAITALGADIIVVGIDNSIGGSDLRDAQLTMSTDFGPLSPLGAPQYGNFADGRLQALGDWMRTTLADYVAANYSVSTRRCDTYIAGSSSGGLAALYVGMRDRDIYGAVCALSPASGLFYREAWQAFLAQIDNSLPQYTLLYCGYDGVDELENILYDATPMGTGIASCNTLGDLLREAGYTQRSRLDEVYWRGAIHREAYWRLLLTQFLATAVK